MKVTNKTIKIIFLILIIIISNLFIFKYVNIKFSYDMKLSFQVISDRDDIYQVFYSDEKDWDEKNSLNNEYISQNAIEKLEFIIPKKSEKIRIDFGNHELVNIKLKNIQISYYGKIIKLDDKKLCDLNNLNQINILKSNEEFIELKSIGNDPYVTYNITSKEHEEIEKQETLINYLLKILLIIVLDLLLIIIMKKSQSVITLVEELYNNRLIIWKLAKNDFKTRYVGSYLGMIWAFINPIVTILIYWFVFEFGLRNTSPIEGVPFILWFSVGLIPWFFFSDALVNSTNCFVEYSYLVKKVVFKISILPVIKIISSVFVHLVFLGFMFIIYISYGFSPTVYILQLVYYLFCTFFITLSLSYLTSSIVLFFKDFGQIINIFLQIGMWMTPIMWNYNIVPDKYQWIIKLNPIYYIVEGYRDSFINHIWFFEKYFQTIYFIILSLSIFGIGALIYKRLKPHFADVL